MQAMLSILSVIIGIVFVLLLFSLLASTVMEIISAMLSLRGKHLLRTLQNMLGDKTDVFLGHPFFRQLAYASRKKAGITAYSLPSWINKNTFSAILTDLLQANSAADLEQKINAMPDGDLKLLLRYLYRQSDGSIEGFKSKVENWFDEVMERASDWFKRSTKWWLFSVGLVLAGIFNADTIQIYQSLSANSALRDDFVNLAGQYVQSHDSVATMDLNKSIDQALPEFKEIAQSYKETVQSPLGLGWTADQASGDWIHWLIKLAGFVISGIAVTFGAPFWFETLKKLISIRPSGATAQPAPVTPQYVVSKVDEPNDTEFESVKASEPKTPQQKPKAVG